MSGTGASPGGPLVTSAKKRRLAALEKRSAGGAPAAAAPAKRQALGGPGRPAAGGSGGSKEGASGASSSQPSSARPGGGNRPGAAAAAPRQREPWYEPLPDDVAYGPAAQAMGVRPHPGAPDGVEGVAAMLQALLATNPRASDADAVAGGRLRDRALLLDNPSGRREAGGAGGPPRRRRAGGPQLTGGLASARQQRAAGLYDLSSAGLTYAAVEPLHRLWQSYVQGLAASCAGLREVQAALLGADLHGCLLRVAEAPPGSHLGGVRGVVVRDAATSFVLVTPEGAVRRVPKAPCVFEYDVDARRVVTLLGAGLAAARGGAGAGAARARR